MKSAILGPNQVKLSFLSTAARSPQVFDPPGSETMHLLRRRPRSAEVEFDDNNAALDASYWYHDACV